MTRPRQYKKLKDALPTYCEEKGYNGLIEILHNLEDWDEKSFFSNKQDALQWSTTVKSKVAVYKNNKAIMQEIVIITDPNLKEELWGKYQIDIKYEDKRWNACQDHKQAIVTVVRSQLDEGRRNELDLYKGYKETMAEKNKDVITILDMLGAICHENDDDGLSFAPYKNTVALWNIRNYVNPKVEDPCYYKDEIKTKFQATLALSGRFPNGTVYMEEMLRRNIVNDTPTLLTIKDYFVMTDENKAL